MKHKRIVCLLLVFGLLLGILTGCAASGTAGAQDPDPTESQAPEATAEPADEPEEDAPADEPGEIAAARELDLIPAGWEEDWNAAADFLAFDEMLTQLIALCNGEALSVYREHVDNQAFPSRDMGRDDALVMLLLAAEPLGFTTYNARQFSFCTENLVDYDQMHSQLSWDYPYCDPQREVLAVF